MLGLVFGDRGAPTESLLVVLLLAVSVSSFNAVNLRLNGTQAWGVKALAASNVTGFLVGLSVILWAGPSLGVMVSVIGYLTGSLISAVGPTVIVWRVDRMRWGLLVLRIAASYALILTGRW